VRFSRRTDFSYEHLWEVKLFISPLLFNSASSILLLFLVCVLILFYCCWRSTDKPVWNSVSTLNRYCFKLSMFAEKVFQFELCFFYMTDVFGYRKRNFFWNRKGLMLQESPSSRYAKRIRIFWSLPSIWITLKHLLGGWCHFCQIKVNLVRYFCLISRAFFLSVSPIF